uniref:Helically-extended SH3 domain-containing protein n=1 Tax=Anser brachyrhynchus TaxID=132585 RepID=A0A8B9BMF4_9AVES
MRHPEGKGAMVRHLQAKFKGNREDLPEAGSWLESRSAASPATEPGQMPVLGSKGEPPPESPRTRRVDFSRAPPPHSKGQSVGQSSLPHPVSETPEWMARLKKGIAQDTSSQPAPAKPGGRDVLNKEVGATSDPPQRNQAQQKWPPIKDKGAPAVPAKGAAVAASPDAVGSTQETGHPTLPRRKPLPHVMTLGARPAKPRRPPAVDLEKFRAAARPGMPGRPAVEPRSAKLGYPKPSCVASGPARFSPQDAPNAAGDEDEIYDDVETVGPVKRDQSVPLPPTSRPPAYLRPGGGRDAGRASGRFALLAAVQREAQASRKMKPMTLKECKKEEKADREFQKKFKFEGSISVLTQMMVDPAVTEKRGGGKNLPLRRGEILDVIEFTNKEQILCRNSQRRYGYVPRAVMLHLDTDIYDDVEIYG